jgi:hypothetical protein
LSITASNSQSRKSIFITSITLPTHKHNINTLSEKKNREIWRCSIQNGKQRYKWDEDCDDISHSSLEWQQTKCQCSQCAGIHH